MVSYSEYKRAVLQGRAQKIGKPVFGYKNVRLLEVSQKQAGSGTAGNTVGVEFGKRNKNNFYFIELRKNLSAKNKRDVFQHELTHYKIRTSKYNPIRDKSINKEVRQLARDNPDFFDTYDRSSLKEEAVVSTADHLRKYPGESKAFKQDYPHLYKRARMFVKL